MANQSVLIVGGSGFVGTYLAWALKDSYKVFATYYSRRVKMPGVSSLPLDLNSHDRIKQLVYSIKPDVIVFTAGSNDLKWAEDNTQKVESLHAGGSSSVLNTSNIFKPKFVYLSNDYVFNGRQGNYHESDIPVPDSSLGRAKTNGESAVRTGSLNYIILRSAPLLGLGNGSHFSFLDKMRFALEKGENFQLPQNEVHAFAPVSGLCHMIKKIIDTDIRNQIFHYGGLTKLSWFALGQALAKRFGYDAQCITPLESGEKASQASVSLRLDYSLNLTRTLQTLKIEPLFLEKVFDLLEQEFLTDL